MLYLPDAHPVPMIVGLNVPQIEGDMSNVKCIVDYYCTEFVSFKWYLGSETIPCMNQTSRKHGNNTATFKSVLLYRFSRINDDKRLICSVTFGEDYTHNAVAMALVTVVCKYTMGCYIE